ncbi:MAG TPA: DUF6510 family protein [Thermomicrobiales bacterium]|jgi:hypothetical protein
MDDAERRLDGNAAAGPLAELFSFDVTTAHAVCAGCGTVAPVGALPAYGREMGIILRCAGCDTALIRVSRVATGYWLDLRGMSVLRVDA